MKTLVNSFHDDFEFSCIHAWSCSLMVRHLFRNQVMLVQFRSGPLKPSHSMCGIFDEGSITVMHEKRRPEFDSQWDLLRKMMKFDINKNREKFVAEEGGSLEIGYTNQGEPYRQGVELRVEDDDGNISYIFLEEYETKKLRDLLNRLFPCSTTGGASDC